MNVHEENYLKQITKAAADLEHALGQWIDLPLPNSVTTHLDTINNIVRDLIEGVKVP